MTAALPALLSPLVRDVLIEANAEANWIKSWKLQDVFEEVFWTVKSSEGELSIGHVSYVDVGPYDISFRVESTDEEGGVESLWIVIPYQR